jgi:hypothetical protein
VAEPTHTLVLPVTTGAPPTPGDGQGAPVGRRNVGWVPIASVAVTLLLIGVIAYAVSRGGENPPDTSSRAGSSTQQTTPQADRATPGGIAVRRSTYVGLKFKDAEHRLRDIGFDVRRQDIDGGEKDIVAGIAPSGIVQKGQQVTLTVYKGEAHGPDDSHGKPGDHKPDKHEED